MNNDKKHKDKKVQKSIKLQLDEQLKKLTDREKSLLYLLAVMLIFVGGGKYIMMPAYEKMAELSVEKDELQMKEEAAVSAIAAMESTKLETQRLMTQILENSDDVSSFLNDEGVDSLITNLCIENNLKPMALAIESDPYAKIDLEKMPETPVTDGAQEAAAEGQSSETSPEQEDSAQEAPLNPEAEAIKYTRAAEVNLLVQGSKQSMLAFIDNINSREYLLVESFTSSFAEPSGLLIGQQTHSIRIKINMLNTELE